MEQERRLVHEELKHCDNIWNEFCQFKLLGLLCKDDGLIYEINHKLSKKLDHLDVRIYKDSTNMLDLKFKKIDNQSE